MKDDTLSMTQYFGMTQLELLLRLSIIQLALFKLAPYADSPRVGRIIEYAANVLTLVRDHERRDAMIHRRPPRPAPGRARSNGPLTSAVDCAITFQDTNADLDQLFGGARARICGDSTDLAWHQP